MNELTAESARLILLSEGETQPGMTRSFLDAAASLAPHLGVNGGPYSSARGLGAWPLSYYGFGTGRLGNYRSTLMLEQDGTYSHFLIGQDNEMETETPHVGPGVDTNSTELGPSFFVEFVVSHNGGEAFSIDRPAAGPSGPEPMLDVLARSLLVISRGGIPPIFTWESQLNGA